MLDGIGFFYPSKPPTIHDNQDYSFIGHIENLLFKPFWGLKIVTLLFNWGFLRLGNTLAYFLVSNS
jgi:hypothetical protein